jgi:hypothetical protein
VRSSKSVKIAGSFAQYEKTRLVTKLRGARERIREAKGKCEGRKSYVESAPELVLVAKRLHRRSPRAIADRSARLGASWRRWATGTRTARRTRHHASSRWSRGLCRQSVREQRRSFQNSAARSSQGCRGAATWPRRTTMLRTCPPSSARYSVQALHSTRLRML